MRPAARASAPDSTASAIARAIAAGSCAREMALAHSTASQPSSIASAASDAVPTPASSTTGTPLRSTMIEMLYGFRIPIPLPIGEPSGITAAHPRSSSLRASTGSSVVYGSTTNPSSALHRQDDLDSGAITELGGAPRPAGDDLAVDGDREATAVRRIGNRGDEPCDRGSGGELTTLAVHEHGHPATPDGTPLSAPA